MYTYVWSILWEGYARTLYKRSFGSQRPSGRAGSRWGGLCPWERGALVRGTLGSLKCSSIKFSKEEKTPWQQFGSCLAKSQAALRDRRLCRVQVPWEQWNSSWEGFDTARRLGGWDQWLFRVTPMCPRLLCWLLQGSLLSGSRTQWHGSWSLALGSTCARVRFSVWPKKMSPWISTVPWFSSARQKVRRKTFCPLEQTTAGPFWTQSRYAFGKAIVADLHLGGLNFQP